MNSLRVATALTVFLLAITSAGAQEPAPKGAAPVLNADTFRLPDSAYDTTKPHPKRATPAPSEGFNPGRFDLGDSVLQLDTKRQLPDTRVGIEAVDPKRLGGITKDTSSPLPNYFGMTLSKPLN
jgi:hypothetical protein